MYNKLNIRDFTFAVKFPNAKFEKDKMFLDKNQFILFLQVTIHLAIYLWQRLLLKKVKSLILPMIIYTFKKVFEKLMEKWQLLILLW